MTAAAPDTMLRALGHAPRLASSTLTPADNGDRNFVTLLSLNFMLLAFFVVLGTASSFDAPRVASVARAVRVVFAPETATKGDSAIRVTARQALQAGVSDAFAGILPTMNRIVGNSGDRVDVSLDGNAVAATDPQAMEDVLEGIAALLRSAPAGIHYNLMLDGGADVPLIVAALLTRGVAPAQLMTGVDDLGALRFSFMLLEGDDATPFARIVPGRTP